MNNLIVCDIQPEYHYAFVGFMPEFVDFINNSSYDNIVFFYNGILHEPNGITEKELKQFFIEKNVNNELLEKSFLYDKGCGEYFVLFKDSVITEKNIIEVGKTFLNDGKVKYLNYIVDRTLFCSRMYRQNTGLGLFSFNSSIIQLQELEGNFDLVGGFSKYCLRELEINFKILDKSYNRLEKFIFY